MSDTDPLWGLSVRARESADRSVTRPALAVVENTSRYDVLSTDLFDTVLLRDASTETERLAWAGHRAAVELGVDPQAVVDLRWSLHTLAYRAVAMERPEGEASLTAITRCMAASLGLGEDAALVLRRAELDVDAEHLRPNGPLLRVLERVRATGARVIAVSDTYYSEADLRQLLVRVVGSCPFAAVYSSADVGLTKHAGKLYDEVSRREGVPADRITHVGDSEAVDVVRANAAGWEAVHLPRSRMHSVSKRVGAVRSLPHLARRRR